jgi:hypothetical protein
MALGIAAGSGLAQKPAAPATATSIMDKAYRQAKTAKKPILVIFGATW